MNFQQLCRKNNVITVDRYHNQYLLKLLTVSFCFLTFVFYLVIVEFIIYSILACNFCIDNCIIFQLLFINKTVDVNVNPIVLLVLCTFTVHIIKPHLWTCSKHRQDCEHFCSQLLFSHQICFYYLLEKLDIFLNKKMIQNCYCKNSKFIASF